MHPMNEVLRASMDSIDTMVDRNRVLVADDSSELRAIVRDALERDGFEVVEAADGRELLRELGVGSPHPPDKEFDLVISDIRMPHMSGLDVLATLRSMHASMPVILITAFGDHETHARAFELGAVVTLDKPLSLLDLRDTVRKLLDPPWW